MLAVFIVAISINLVRGNAIDCVIPSARGVADEHERSRRAAGECRSADPRRNRASDVVDAAVEFVDSASPVSELRRRPLRPFKPRAVPGPRHIASNFPPAAQSNPAFR